MSNELLFFLQMIVSLSFVLGLFKLGKEYLIGYIGFAVILSQIFVNKQFDLFGLAASGGNVMYASLFLATDLLSEWYGKKEAKRAVNIGLCLSVIYLALSQFIIAYSPNGADWGAAEWLGGLFSLSPSIVIGSLLAYACAQYNDVHLFHKLKEKFNGKHLWLRNNVSTAVSQFIDTFIFIVFAFWLIPNLIGHSDMLLPLNVMIQIFITTYIFKLFVGAIDTAFIYVSRHI